MHGFVYGEAGKAKLHQVVCRSLGGALLLSLRTPNMVALAIFQNEERVEQAPALCVYLGIPLSMP